MTKKRTTFQVAIAIIAIIAIDICGRGEILQLFGSFKALDDIVGEATVVIFKVKVLHHHHLRLLLHRRSQILLLLLLLYLQLLNQLLNRLHF